MQHPAVKAAAVVGLPHVRLGEQVAALVQLKAQAQRTAGQSRQSCSLAMAWIVYSLAFVNKTCPPHMTISDPAGKLFICMAMLLPLLYFSHHRIIHSNTNV